jgi:hypothetical protein
MLSAIFKYLEKKFIKAVNIAHIILLLAFLFIHAHAFLSTCTCQYLFESLRWHKIIVLRHFGIETSKFVPKNP